MNIYLPFEGKARELAARIFFCTEAAKRGHKSFFGHKSDLYPIIPKLKPGIYFHKSIQRRKIKQIEQLKKYGHFNAAIDEEALCILNKTIYFDYRLTRKNLNKLDIFFAWGKRHKDLILKKYTDLKTEVACAGNSRIDVSKCQKIYSKDVKRINLKYPEFYLFATKFVTSNFVPRGANSYREMAKWNLPEMSDKVFEELRESEEWDKKNRNLFIEGIKECASRFPDKAIVIRPHPAENHKLWKDLVNSIPTNNVYFHEPSDSIIPWIIACEKIVSFNCTTLLDASLISCKGINYLPLPNKLQEYEVFHHCSKVARTKEELIELIGYKELPAYDNKKMKEYIHNWDESSFCDYSMSIIEDKVDNNFYSQTNLKLSFISLILNKILNNFKKFYSLYFGNGQRRRKIYKQKFPGINLREVKEIHKNFDISKGTRIYEYWPGVFCVEKI